MTQPNITRRSWFTSAGLLTSAGMAAAGAAEPKGRTAAEQYPRNLTKEDVDRWMTELSNWGKWGKDDQAGTINLITPAKRKAAAALVREGVCVSMSLDADLPKEGSTGGPLGGMGGGPRGGAPGQAGRRSAGGSRAGGGRSGGARRPRRRIRRAPHLDARQPASRARSRDRWPPTWWTPSRFPITATTPPTWTHPATCTSRARSTTDFRRPATRTAARAKTM